MIFDIVLVSAAVAFTIIAAIAAFRPRRKRHATPRRTVTTTIYGPRGSATSAARRGECHVHIVAGNGAGASPTDDETHRV